MNAVGRSEAGTATDAGFAAAADPYRRELLAHCYRMLGSFHDAEDAVQDTFLRAWRGFEQFEGRSSVRTWLYRIATNVCLTMAAGRQRRVLPSGLGDPEMDGSGPLATAQPEVPWLEPIPGHALANDPAELATGRESIRLAFVVALQDLPARQRAALLLRDVVGLPTVDVAEQLDLSPAAVNSALQRARARLQEGTRPEEVTMSDGDMKLLDQYIAAFERADVEALSGLLRHDIQLEMPPIPSWFSDREAVVDFLASRPLRSPARRLLPTSANGCPAAATYILEGDGSFIAHSIQVLDVVDGQITHIYAFRDPELFAMFGLPGSLDQGSE